METLSVLGRVKNCIEADVDTSELKVVRLEGEPRARGRMHGELLRNAIAELIERWGDSLERIYGVDRRRYVELFHERTIYQQTLERAAPSVLAEVRGIAEGAAVAYPSLLAFQHVNEEFELGPLFAGIAPVGGKCSTIVLPPTPKRPGLVAQNLDLAQYLDGYQVLLRGPCDASEGEVLTLSVPGMISLNGMNSNGFAVCDNTLAQLRPDPAGVPIFALYRLLLESRCLADAMALIEATPHAVGLNWVMGDPDGVAMVERSGADSVVFGPLNDDEIAYHTNHPIVCRDWREDRAKQPYRSSYLRHASLHQRLHGRHAAELGVEELKQTLTARDDSNYPVSRGGGVNTEDQQIGFTLACSVFELRRAAPRWHIASGPPHTTDFRIFGFD
jgi:hypothetical protein